MNTRTEAPTYTQREHLADLAGHVLGVTASITGLVILVLVGREFAGTLALTSYSIYGVALVLVFAVSALYHEVRLPRAKAFLRVADHAMIYVLIAGTYTPITLIGVQGAWGWSLFGVVWAIAIIGITLKIALPGRLERLSIALYILAGWVGVAGIGHLIDVLPWPALTLIVAGGVLYTVGVVFHLWHRLPYHNVIWHVFVLGGATAHYFSIIYFVRPSV